MSRDLELKQHFIIEIISIEFFDDKLIKWNGEENLFRPLYYFVGEFLFDQNTRGTRLTPIVVNNCPRQSTIRNGEEAESFVENSLFFLFCFKLVAERLIWYHDLPRRAVRSCRTALFDPIPQLHSMEKLAAIVKKKVKLITHYRQSHLPLKSTRFYGKF